MTQRALTTNHVLRDVLADLDVPHIEDRLSRDFFFQLGLAFPQQYGIACRDVAACVKRAEALGAGPFLHTKMKPPNWIERGEKLDCTLEFALGYAGDAQIEFLGPGRGTEHYARALTDTDITLHHVGIYQRGMPEISATLEAAGYPTAVTGGLTFGPALTIDFRYFDAREQHDLYLEILDFHTFGLPLSTEPAVRAYAAVKRALSGKARR